MIRHFALRNYFSFREGAEINFSFDGNVPDAIRNGRDVSTVLGIKGANGSGKTNLIKALAFLQSFATESAAIRPGRRLVFNHFDNPDDSDFQIEFEHQGTVWFYRLSLNAQRISHEAIWRKQQKKTLLLERRDDQLVHCVAELEPLKSLRLRSDATLLSQYRQFHFSCDTAALDAVHQALANIYSNVSIKGFQNLEQRVGLSDLSRQYRDKPDALAFVLQIIQCADSSISAIQIHSHYNSEGEEELFPVFIHRYDDRDVPVAFVFESSGTKTLYRSLALYWNALANGALLCLDEFDIHLHALILPALLELFLDPARNPHGAQLLFTAHNTEIIDLLGKYRTILVNKEGSESYSYRLDEIPGSLVRNDRPIVPLYLKGRIGGVPGQHE